jgi:glutaconate CoA-transferase subunit A
MAQAATRTFVSCEQVVPTEALLAGASHHTMRISRLWTDGVVERAGGAHFTSCVPDYERDEAFQREYAKSAGGPDEWAAFRSGWLDIDEAEYQKKVTAR